MSGTTTTPPADPLWTPQTIIALLGMGMVAGTIAGVFLKGDPPTLQLVVGLVIGTYGGSVFSFYFGSSKGSQKKDDALAAREAGMIPAAQQPGATTTTTTTVPAAPVVPVAVVGATGATG